MHEHLNSVYERARDWKIVWSNHIDGSLSINPYYQQLIGIRDMFLLMDFVGVADYIQYINNLLLNIGKLYHGEN